MLATSALTFGAYLNIYWIKLGKSVARSAVLATSLSLLSLRLATRIPIMKYALFYQDCRDYGTRLDQIATVA